jgi:cyclophilin family peptidyl-prolyl cis-trans isomerase
MRFFDLVFNGNFINFDVVAVSENRILYGEQATFFSDEIRPHLRHKKIGTVSMANIGPNLNASQVTFSLNY